MSRQLTEKKALKKLGIKDFRQLKKEHGLQLASMLDQMEPEVAKKALEQFPEFASIIKEVLTDYQSVLDKGFSSNEESMKAVRTACGAIMTSLQKELEKDTLTFEEKKYIIEQMKEIAMIINEKDTENKKWLSQVYDKAAIFGFCILGVTAGVLGGRFLIKLPGTRFA